MALDNAGLYEAERAAREAAESANRAKDEFLSVLSHELRTPLTPILGFTEMLRRRKEVKREMLDHALEAIDRSARVQARLVGDLLDVSRIVSGKLQIERQPVDLRQVIRAATDAVRAEAEARSIALVSDLDPAAAAVTGDPDRLQQVVWNLLSNAVKFTPQGGRVEERLARDGGQAVITVTDTGQGIPPEFLPHVFERFRQADGSSTRAHGGLGLGLAIVRHLVELHGGRVTAASEGAGKGATFTVHLPLASPAPVPRAADPVDGVESAALAGVRVLVVEDDADTRGLLRLALEGEGALVTASASSAEALAAFEAATPDVLLADIGMPDEDGYQLISRIRARSAEAGGRVPAVALTAYAAAEDRRRAMAAGFQRHLAKPVNPTALVAVLVALTAGPAQTSG
jgi:CheY-like chemotaxis protein